MEESLKKEKGDKYNLANLTDLGIIELVDKESKEEFTSFWTKESMHNTGVSMGSQERQYAQAMN